MAKKKQKQQKKASQPQKQQWQLTPWQQWGLAVLLIVITVLIYFEPIVFENKVPPSTDILAWKGNAQSIIEARQEYSYTPLWANNVFSGMPAHLISLKPPFEQPAKYIMQGLSAILSWHALYYILGAAGMLLLMRFLNLSLIASTFTALAFIWWPNLLGLLEAGHNSKAQTILLIPLALYTFLRILRKPDLLNFSLFTIAFSLVVRAGHYQIVFYTGLILLAFSIAKLIQFIREKAWKKIAVIAVFTPLALGIGIGMSAFHTLQVREYSKYSVRGVSSEEEKEGTDFEYATQWSLHPAEMYNFIIPRFFGGHSSQLYEGDDVPQLKDRTIPGYWGHMPFTSTTDYMGVITLVFAVLGILLLWQRREVKTLSILIFLSLLLAFGRHFPPLYNLFFNAVPFFNHFRVPTMIVSVVFFSFTLLAGMGLHALLTKAREMQRLKLLRVVLITFGLFAALGLAPFVFRNSLDFLRPQEAQQYNPQIIEALKNARFDLLKGDAVRMLALLAGAFALVLAYINKWIGKAILSIGIGVLLLIDLFGIDQRYLQQLVPESQMDNYFAATRVDNALKQTEGFYRLYPMGDFSDQPHWPYHHQTITGYHPAKLRIYQDIRESVMMRGSAPGFNNPDAPINWNLVNMLNTKFLLSPRKLQHPNLTMLISSEEMSVYRNTAALPRVWCVGQTEVIADKDARLMRLNDPAFDPAETAILEEPLDAEIAAVECQPEITRYEPNYIDIVTNASQQTLLVLSEIYYPAGWKVFIDDQPGEILQVNHILRGVVLPAGEHTLHFKLEPKSYDISVAMMGGSIAVTYILLIIALVPVYKRYRSSKQ
ncbi:MAG: hypothetical protein U5R06_20295 [candidate division KSB1 bacterium]|nr:hypothetical protein [candidate division KSB1 bacterium]